MSDKTNKTDELPESPASYWQESIDFEVFPQLDQDKHVDVVIVGGGITGITSAYLLVNEGYEVAIVEADRLLNGTTGHTTAKITAQHDLIYDELIQNSGVNQARLYYEANIEAVNFIKKTVEQQQIDCDFSEQDAYLYATTDQYKSKLETEAKAYERLGITGELVNQMPLDIEMRNALVMKNQAQFHPVKYLSHLIQIIKEKGGVIFENTTAVNVETGKQPAVLTKQGARLTGDFVLSCTHFPFYEGLGFYSTRLHADRSYILAAEIEKSFPGGMYISADQPTRSVRSASIDGKEMVLIAGESHKTGQGKNTMTHYEALASFAQHTFGLKHIAYRWSAQDLVTLDKIPYVGSITPEQSNLLIATGFRKWGMSNGTAAALLFRDLIKGEKNPFQSLYTPSRLNMHPSLKNFITQNANVAAQLVKGKIEIPDQRIKDLANDEGAVVRVKGERKGAYRDKEGTMHIVDTTCTHVGCEVEWNEAERTWDCPCHGSRFSYTGEVIEGPAEKPLQQYDYKMIDNLTSEDSGY